MADEKTTPDYNKKPWIKMPRGELSEPRPGRRCHAPAWWVVTPDDCVLFYRDYGSPQCNVNEAVTRHVLGRLHKGCRAEFIETAFVPAGFPGAAGKWPA